MNLSELAVLYLIAGLISAFVLGRRTREVGSRRLFSVLLALLLWPLWLPVALGREEPPAASSESAPTVSEQALFQGYEAVKGTPLEKLLPRESVERIALELRRVVERGRELAALLSQPSFSLEVARARVLELEQATGNTRALAIAQRHVENVERLAALHARDRQLLAELGDWLATLRTQLVLARYSASSAEGVGDIFAEVCARVEVLGSTLDEPPLTMPELPSLAWPNTFS
jgi:hypothetical protein